MPKTHLSNFEYLKARLAEIHDDLTKPWKWYPCLLWDRYCDGGYGKLHVNGKVRGPHQLAYDLTYGKIAPGLFVCHHCDIRNCFRPIHLFAGTNLDNMADMVRKKRRFPVNNSGERHGMSTLCEDDVTMIHLWHLIGVPNQGIAEHFGVCRNTISRIVQGTRWHHRFTGYSHQPLLHLPVEEPAGQGKLFDSPAGCSLRMR